MLIPGKKFINKNRFLLCLLSSHQPELLRVLLLPDTAFKNQYVLLLSFVLLHDKALQLLVKLRQVSFTSADEQHLHNQLKGRPKKP